MLRRGKHLAAVRTLLTHSPVTAILGARQVGKTTLARQVARSFAGPVAWFDLEDDADLARLTEPLLVLREAEGLVVIDEIQRRPDIFSALRVLADRADRKTKFLILGSAAPTLIRHASESLAGRIGHYYLPPLSPDEAGWERVPALWLRGGFPRSFLAHSDKESGRWRRDFIHATLERDMPALGITIPAATLRRFWSMLAHYHGQIWNGSEFGRSFGISDMTVRRYLDILTGAFFVRQLQPWHENISKRQVKAPKIYLSDSGILHALLDIDTTHDLRGHPKLGASWEGFALEAVVQGIDARPEECYFWSTHAGAEIDLVVMRGKTRLGFEFKHTETPRVTPSMRSALADLRLDRIEVIHAGHENFPLAEKIRAVPLREFRSTGH